MCQCPWGNGKPHWPQKGGRGGGRVMMEISVFGLSMGSHFGRRNEGARRRGRPGSLWGIMVRDWQKLYVVVTNTPTTNHTHRPSSDLCERSTADLPPTQPPIGPDALPLPQSRHPAARSNLSSGRACRTRFSHRNPTGSDGAHQSSHSECRCPRYSDANQPEDELIKADKSLMAYVSPQQRKRYEQLPSDSSENGAASCQPPAQ